MANCEFGFAYKLDPAITIGGKVYGILVRFADFPANRTITPTNLEDGNVIVSGLVHEIKVGEGENRKKIVCERGLRLYAYPVTLAAGWSYDELIEYAGGGNIAILPEPAHAPYCSSDAWSNSGMLNNLRAKAGDVCWINKKAYLIEQAIAMGEKPAVVDWHTSALSRSIRIKVGSIKENGEYKYKGFFFSLGSDINQVVLEDDGTGLFDDCAVKYDSTAMTRIVFGGSEGYLPITAHLNYGEYWYDPIKQRLLFPYQCAMSGGSAWGAIANVVIDWYVGGFKTGTFKGIDTTPDTIVYKGVGNDSYDSFGGMFEFIDTTYDRYIKVEKVYGENAGYTWRKDYTQGAPFISWNIMGGMLSVSYRQVQDATPIIQSVGTVPVSFPIYLKFDKDGGSLYHARYSINGTVWTDVDFESKNPPSGGITIDFDLCFMGGVFALAESGIKFQLDKESGIENRTTEDLFETGVIYQKMHDTYAKYNNIWGWQQPLPSGFEVASVTNETTGATMSSETLGNDLNRQQYSLGGGNIYLPYVCYGDTVIVVSAEEAGGRVPEGKKNFSNADNIKEHNIGNWYDYLVVYDPLGELSGLVGEELTIRQNGIFNPRGDFKIYWDELNNTETDFALIADNQLYKRPLEGYVLILQDWIDTNLVAGKRYCFKAEGGRFLKYNSVNARYLNEAVNCIQVMNTTFAQIGSGQSETIWASGWNQIEPSSFGCLNGTKYPLGFAEGLRKNCVEAHSLAARASGFEDNNWKYDDRQGKGGWSGTVNSNLIFLYHYYSGDLKLSSSEYPVCCRSEFELEYIEGGSESENGYDGQCGDGDKIYNGDIIVSGDFHVNYSHEYITSTNYITNGYSNRLFGSGFCSDFNFSGVPIGVLGLLKRIDSGSIINYAKLQFSMVAAQYYTYDYSEELYLAAENDWQIRRWGNGQPTPDRATYQGWQNGCPANLRMMIIKRKRDSRQFYNCGDMSLPWNHQYAYVGGFGDDDSFEGTTATNFRKILDITFVIQGLINDKDSEFADYLLFPAVGAGMLDINEYSKVGSFMKALLPPRTIETVTLGYRDEEFPYGNPLNNTNMISYQANGIKWTNLVPENLIINFTLPSGCERKIIINSEGRALE